MLKKLLWFIAGSGILCWAVGLVVQDYRESRKATLPPKYVGPIPREGGGFNAAVESNSTTTYQCHKALFIIQPKGERIARAAIPVDTITFTRDDYHASTRERPYGWYEKNISDKTIPAGEFTGFGIKIVHRRFANQELRGSFIITLRDESQDPLDLGLWDVTPTKR
jgi:hypothetical protein